jgi:hypothetical protein
VARHVHIGVVTLAGLLAAQDARGQLQQTEYEAQKEQALRYEPAPLLAPTRQGGGAAATVRVRFYADDEYRSSGGGGRWQDRVRVMLGLLNQVVEPSFGVRFEGESFRRWPRQGQSGALPPMLDQLEKLDAGPDVDWVVGLVSPLPLVSMSFHDLGCARVLGRHFVLRGMTSIAELDDFKRVLPKLDQKDREALYGRRKSHKELSIFLHEWAHTLGGLHVQDGTRIMGQSYSNRTSTFSVEDANLIGAGLDARLEARGKEAIDWTPLRKALDGKGDWFPPERESLATQLRRAPVVSERVPTVPIPGLRPGGSPFGAAGPGEGGLRRPGDLFGGAAPVGLGAGRPTGGDLPPGAPDSGGRRPAGDPSAAEASGARRPGGPGETPGGGRSGGFGARRSGPQTGPLADARKLIDRGELTAAARLLAAAGPDVARAGAGDLVEARRRLGLAAPGKAAGKGFTLPPEEEAPYAATVDEAMRLMRAGKAGAAQAALDRGLKKYAGAPGLLVAQCELLLRQNRPRAALKPCNDALEVMEDLPHAHYLLGCIQAEIGEADEAIASLKRSIALERNDQKVWDALAQLYRGLGRGAEYAQFAAKHGM